jgi:hypothetical protein
MGAHIGYPNLPRGRSGLTPDPGLRSQAVKPDFVTNPMMRVLSAICYLITLFHEI